MFLTRFFFFIFNFLISAPYSHHIARFWPKSPALRHLTSVAALLAHMADESLKVRGDSDSDSHPSVEGNLLFSVSRGFSFSFNVRMLLCRSFSHICAPKTTLNRSEVKRCCRSLTWELLHKTCTTNIISFVTPLSSSPPLSAAASLWCAINRAECMKSAEVWSGVLLIVRL